MRKLYIENNNIFHITDIEELNRHHQYRVNIPVFFYSELDKDRKIKTTCLSVKSYFFKCKSGDLDEILNELDKLLSFMSHIYTIEIPNADWKLRTIAVGTIIEYRALKDFANIRIIERRKEKIKRINENIVYNESNLDTMERMSNNYLDGIITSPPYNICTERQDMYYKNGYNDNDNLTPEDFINLRIKEFKEFNRVVKDDGVICYNISYHKENPILPILLINEVHKQTNLTVADIISWKRNSSIPFQTDPTKLSRIVEQVYVIVNKNHLHSFKTNKEVSKINEKTGQKFYKNYTNLVEAKNNDGYKTSLKASFSEEFVLKLLNIYFFPENSLIYDPFMGIFTTARACKKSGRNYIGSEISKTIYEEGQKLTKK